jgi:hypothetical protein
MLRSGKELKVFSISETDLKKFASESRRYGVLYCALRNSKGTGDTMVDVMVRAEDASKINRIVERFKFAKVDTATVQADIEKSKSAKTRTRLKMPCPTRARMISCLTNCLKSLCKRSKHSRKTPRWRKRKNPLRQSLPQSSQGHPKRVLLMGGALSVRN